MYNNIKVHKFLIGIKERANEFIQDAMARMEAISQLIERASIYIDLEYCKLKKNVNVSFEEDAGLYLLKQCDAGEAKKRA